MPVRPTVPLVTSSRLSFLEVLPTSCSTQWCWCWPESAVIAAVLTVVSGHSVQSVSFLSNSRRMIRLEVLNCFGSEVLHRLCYNALPTCSHPPPQRLERCMSIVTSMTTGVSEREANDALNAYVSTMSLHPFCLGKV